MGRVPGRSVSSSRDPLGALWQRGRPVFDYELGGGGAGGLCLGTQLIGVSWQESIRALASMLHPRKGIGESYA